MAVEADCVSSTVLEALRVASTPRPPVSLASRGSREEPLHASGALTQGSGRMGGKFEIRNSSGRMGGKSEIRNPKSYGGGWDAFLIPNS